MLPPTTGAAPGATSCTRRAATAQSAARCARPRPPCPAYARAAFRLTCHCRNFRSGAAECCTRRAAIARSAARCAHPLHSLQPPCPASAGAAFGLTCHCRNTLSEVQLAAQGGQLLPGLQQGAPIALQPPCPASARAASGLTCHCRNTRSGAAEGCASGWRSEETAWHAGASPAGEAGYGGLPQMLGQSASAAPI